MFFHEQIDLNLVLLIQLWWNLLNVSHVDLNLNPCPIVSMYGTFT